MAKGFKEGDKLPEITFESTDPNLTSFNDLLGKNIVLYFYPKDNTPGCTTEGRDFAALYPKFQKANTEIIGISRDSMKSHAKFCEKYAFPFPLISDQDEKLCKLFGVMIEKNMFAKLVFGIERSTFLIDTQGVIQKIWRPVKVKGHAEAVLEQIG